MKIPFPLVPIVLGASALCAPAQQIAFESFSGMTVDGDATGSGSDAAGWSDPAWAGPAAPRFKIADPLPDLGYQVTRGQWIDGSNRALELTTAPPANNPDGELLTRHFTPVNTTVYFSCLVRLDEVGTGTESIFIGFGNASRTLQRIRIRPNGDQTAGLLDVPLVTETNSRYGSAKTLSLDQTHLLVVKLGWEQDVGADIVAEYWIDPPATQQDSGNFSRNRFTLPVEPLDTMGFMVWTSDESGPATIAQFDEVRIGYTWQDVVLEPAAPVLVPDTELREARHLRWQSMSGVTYQPKYSHDLVTWHKLGGTIAGDGTLKGVFDDTEGTEKKYYRVEVIGTP
jgi:hypothetical protein